MKLITRREFLHYPGKILKEGSFVVTNRGIKEYVVTIARHGDVTTKDNVVTKPETFFELPEDDQKEIISKAAKKANADQKKMSDLADNKRAYGCGCKIKDGATLCPKHGRL